MTHLDVHIALLLVYAGARVETSSKRQSAPLKRAKRPNPENWELFPLETVMHDDTVRVEDAFTVVSGAFSQAARATVVPESPPVAMPYADLVTVGGGAASSSSPTCAATAAARSRTDRYGEAIQQAAQLASWEDEGGTTSS